MNTQILSENIAISGAQAVRELIEAGSLTKGDILVIGCSSSEIIDGMLPVLTEKGIYLAAQCCEHLNRALVIEKECAEKYFLERVSVIPQPKAGGSFATICYESFASPVMVENIKAHAGIDIGDTLIGMHLRSVAVPVRTKRNSIGSAHVVCARTRLKYVGGERAIYQ